MDELITWLRAQLDTDDWLADEMDRTATHVRSAVSINASPLIGTRQCLDGQQLRREVEAKRAIIDEVLRYEAKIDGERGCCHYEEDIGAGNCPEINPDEIEALRLLASVYADRPGYRDEWRP